MQIRWEYPEQPDEEMTAHVLTVKKIAHVAPMSAQQLLDAGIPLPPGMEVPPEPPRPPRRRRLRWACRNAVRRLRERVGFWIAGYRPEEDW